MTNRRFDDTQPALEPIDQIRDSNWNKLTEGEKADLLRRREVKVLEHLEHLVEGQVAARTHIIDVMSPMLEANTAATARTEAKVDASEAKLDELLERTAKPLALWKDIEGTTGLIGRVATFLKDSAWVAVPVAMVLGGWQAVVAWMKAGFPGPWK
jgi:hypothetical protein